jgi:histidinol-phosphate aminotransferase
MPRGDAVSLPTAPILGSVRPVMGRLDFHEPGIGLEQAARQYGIETDQLVKLNSNECCYGPAPQARKAVRSECRRLSLYPTDLYEPLAMRIAEEVGLSLRNVLLGPGAESIIRYVTQMFIDPGDEAIVARQSFDAAPWWTLLMGGVVRYVDLDDYHFDLNTVERAVTKRTKLIWLCSPNNPTGTIVRKGEFNSFMTRVSPTIGIVLDQAYQEFVDDPDYANGQEYLAAGYRNTIVIRTFSKAYGLAGLRLGYALLDGDLANLAEQSHEPFHVSREAAAAGLAALADDQWLARHVAGVRQRRTWLAIQIEQLGLSAPPSQANFLLVNTRRPAGIVAERMLRYGVSVRAAASWGYPTHVRISVGKPSQCRQAIRVLRKVCAEVDATGDSVGMERGGQ